MCAVRKLLFFYELVEFFIAIVTELAQAITSMIILIKIFLPLFQIIDK